MDCHAPVLALDPGEFGKRSVFTGQEINARNIPPDIISPGDAILREGRADSLMHSEPGWAGCPSGEYGQSRKSLCRRKASSPQVLGWLAAFFCAVCSRGSPADTPPGLNLMT